MGRAARGPLPLSRSDRWASLRSAHPTGQTTREDNMTIFTHVTVGTNDLNKARAFYDSVLAPLGLKRLKDFGDGGPGWWQSTEEFMVRKPAGGKPGADAE